MSNKVNLNKHDHTYTVYADPWVSVTSLYPEPIEIDWDDNGMDGCDVLPAGTPIVSFADDEHAMYGYSPYLIVDTRQESGIAFCSYADILGSSPIGYLLRDTPRGELLTLVTAGTINVGTYLAGVLERFLPEGLWASPEEIADQLQTLSQEYKRGYTTALTQIVMLDDDTYALNRIAKTLWEKRYKAVHEAKGKAKANTAESTTRATPPPRRDNNPQVGDQTNPGGL